jgi:hypothetical protein
VGPCSPGFGGSGRGLGSLAAGFVQASSDKNQGLFKDNLLKIKDLDKSQNEVYIMIKMMLFCL